LAGFASKPIAAAAVSAALAEGKYNQYCPKPARRKDHSWNRFDAARSELARSPIAPKARGRPNRRSES